MDLSQHGDLGGQVSPGTEGRRPELTTVSAKVGLEREQGGEAEPMGTFSLTHWP